jgi:glutamate synthase domain-containing protein 3
VLKIFDNPFVDTFFTGTGMHGGKIFIRTENIDQRLLGKEVKSEILSNEDLSLLNKYLEEYCKIFNLDLNTILAKPFLKLYPYSHRPYGRLYAY